MKVHLISLGCPKNLVDSEVLAGLFKKTNCQFVNKIEEADVVVLNSCAFIGDARKETKYYINRLSKEKLKYNFKLIVTGCLPQVEKNNLLKLYPEIDAVFGVSDYRKIPSWLYLNNAERELQISSQPDFIPDYRIPRLVSTPESYVYVKIADGCDNKCSYCLIPTIRGSYRERPLEDIVREVRRLVENTPKEIILVSQDTTLYGVKLYKKQMLHKLISELSKIKNVFWIRILYTHPAHFYDELINEIATNQKVCKYLDIPIQHTSDKILAAMQRHITRKEIFNLIEKLRRNIKDVVLRTTVMVGFPGETGKDFKLLLNDIRQIEFDWLGSFMFSAQKGTPAYRLFPKVERKIKKERLDAVMSLQQKITYMKNKSRIGKTYTVFVDSINFGHTGFQSPEIDGKTYFVTQPKKIIETIKVKNVVDIYDLYAEII
ncbi:MAG: 30S ribosomal protein S12 methylthiotransferase RimO [Endomicrobia bacterium]|nr:30S ribosomal protein S12 methylthiotransferase RimO [Endomicrobiia bacterium]